MKYKAEQGVPGYSPQVASPQNADVGLRKMGYRAFNGPSTTGNEKSSDHAGTISECEARNSQ